MDPRRSVRAAAIIGCTTLAGWALVRADQQLNVRANVLVSGANRAVPHMEVVACADRSQPSTLLVGSMASVRGQYVTFLYRSGDGGKNWKQVLQTVDAGSFADPTCAFSVDGGAYYGVIVKPSRLASVPGVPRISTWIYSSRDNGRTWSPEPAKQVGVDRPFLATDQSSERRKGYAYYSGLWLSESLEGADPAAASPDDRNVETGIALFVSADHGRTFALKATPRQGRNGEWVFGVGNSVVTASGEIITPFGVLADRFSRPYAERSGESTLSVIRARPGGESPAPVVSIGVVRGSASPALTVDMSHEGPFHDRVYTVTVDAGSVVLFWSADEGRTWHGPTTVRVAAASSDSGLEPIVFNPAVAVNRDGVVGVAWAEGTRANGLPRNPSWVYRMAASWDGGESFSDSVTVSSDRHHPSHSTSWALRATTARGDQGTQRGAVSVDAFSEGGGHTFGLTADSEGLFHPVWTDNRTGIPQVWTAAVRAAGQAARSDRNIRDVESAVDKVDDLTSQTAVELGEIAVSPESRTITLTARVRNTSDLTLLRPLRLHVADIRSALGAVTRLIQPGGRAPSADVCDLSELVPSAGLPSGQATADTALSFEVQGNGDLRTGRDAGTVLEMSFRVYGRLRSSIRRNARPIW